MSLSRRQQRLPTGIDDAVSRPDPRMASMLAAFGRITAGRSQAAPGRDMRHHPNVGRGHPHRRADD